jgi:hypothetical protein
MKQPDLELARERGHGAAESAADHSDRIDAAWSAKAEQMLVAFSIDCRRDFTIEEARKYAHERGLAEPVEPRAWGAVAQRVKRAGGVEAVGFAPTLSSNGSPKVLWRRVPRQGEQLELAA